MISSPETVERRAKTNNVFHAVNSGFYVFKTWYPDSN